MIARRRLLIACGAGILAAPLASYAQQARVWRIGLLVLETEQSYLDAFVGGMRDLGYVEGKNLSIQWRLAKGNNELIAGMAEDLVRLKVDVVVAVSSVALRAARRASTSIPIVSPIIVDPIGSGFAATLSRPGGNITGLSNIAMDVSTKHLEFLSMIVPNLSRVCLIVNLDNSAHPEMLRHFRTAAKRMNIDIVSVDARTYEEIETGYAAMKKDRIGALILAPDTSLNRRFRQVADFAIKHNLPSASLYSAYAIAGGLFAYGPDPLEFFRRAASYVDKIFKGAKPAELPIEQPTKVQFVINRKTARALGLSIPQELLVRADEVIE